MAALWALSCERKRISLEFRLCCLMPLQGLLLAPGRCRFTRATTLHWTFFVFPTVNIVLSGRLSSAVPALGE